MKSINIAFVLVLSVFSSFAMAMEQDLNSSTENLEDCVFEDAVDTMPELPKPAGMLGVLHTQLDTMSTLTFALLPVAGQSDHIYTLIANSLRGGAGLLSALASRDIGQGLVAGMDLVTAAASGVRAYGAVFGNSRHEAKVFNELTTNLDMITSLSNETKTVLGRVKCELAQVNHTLAAGISAQETVLEKLMNHNQAQISNAATAREQLQNALELLKGAQARLQNFEIAAITIESTWNEANTLLQKLDNAFNDTINSREDFEERVLEMRTLIEDIKQLLASLTQPWKTVAEAFSELAQLNQILSGALTNQSDYCSSVIQDAETMRQCNIELCEENARLKQAQGGIETCMAGDFVLLSSMNAQILESSSAAKGNADELKVIVAKKYDLAHLLIGAGVAVAAASVLAFGTVPAAGLGLLTCHGSKIIGAFSADTTPEELVELTVPGRLLCKMGVSANTVRTFGRWLLGRTYSVDNPKDQTPPKSNSNND